MLCHHHLLTFIGIIGWIQSIVFVHSSAPPPLTQQQKLDWLNDHNVVRCQQNAVTMPALIWDDALEKVAQAWANTCPQGHNSAASTQYQSYTGFTQAMGYVGDVGENYAAGYATPEAGDAAWAAEKPTNGGHYTQMVWANTLRVGCAMNTVSCNGFGTYYLCEYYPPGNYIGESAFQSGGSQNTDACTYQARTDFPTMVWDGNGGSTTVNAINGISGAATVGPATSATTTQTPTSKPATVAPITTRPPTTTRPPSTTQSPATQSPATATPVTNSPSITSAPITTAVPTSSSGSSSTATPTNPPPSSTTTTPASGTTTTPTSGPTDPNTGGALSGTPQPAGQSGTQSNGGSSTNIGLIVGVVVGMVVGVVVIAILIYLIYRHYSHSTSWLSSKTHITNFQPHDLNRYPAVNNQPSAEVGPQPLTSISSSTPAAASYNPGHVFNPTSFGAHGGAATTAVQGNWSHHQKHESMDNYQANPALAAAAQQPTPVIPTSRPQMPVPTPPSGPPTGQFGGQAMPAGGVTPFPPSQPRPW